MVITTPEHYWSRMHMKYAAAILNIWVKKGKGIWKGLGTRGMKDWTLVGSDLKFKMYFLIPEMYFLIPKSTALVMTVMGAFVVLLYSSMNVVLD